jgi:protein-L-isoaspartate(D-aspartate) O-methyltransferase
MAFAHPPSGPITRMSDFALQRRNMVDAQLRTNDVTDPRIHRAMLDVPREAFVPETRQSVAYAERCLELGAGRALLDPRAFAKLVQASAIEDSDTVLDIGCATGYSTAILSRLAARVIALEEDAVLSAGARTRLGSVANVTLASGSLAAGWPPLAPYDAIFLNGSVEFVPEALFAQVNEGGRLACFMRMRAGGAAVVFTRHEGAIGDRQIFDADVPVLPGFKRRQGFVF